MKFVQKAIKSAFWWAFCAATSLGFSKLWLLFIVWFASVYPTVKNLITPINLIWETTVSLAITGGAALAFFGKLSCATCTWRFLLFVFATAILSSVNLLFSATLKPLRNLFIALFNNFGFAQNHSYALAVWVAIPLILLALLLVISKKVAQK